ncbi:40-kDa huntingtin-associated protein isoform X1 [Homalodisca vitripennis]|uniref:40-kDa huntingtin-associated protein isoform X1 n=2 Tax=Homalodisca vitripennis TaxID=197043 RepID=UPI001EEA1D51|nr:40-kDa huntingtin-associated protein isoform X1 [Homalodisca vitripennis]
MVDSSVNDFLSQYKSISNKLKKRFLRKPNVAEPSDQFGALGVQCERDEMPQYAGLCYLAVSRCEAALNNPTGEAWAQVRAGRQFLQAHSQQEVGGLVSPGGELLEAAISSLGRAGLLWPSEPERFLAAGLALETGTVLRTDRPHQSAASLVTAVNLLTDHPPLQLHALLDLASCRIRMGDLDGALSVLSQTVSVVEMIADPPFGIYADILLSCEVSRVLLLLLLRPPPQLLPAHLTAVLERYSWLGDTTECPVAWMCEDLYMTLQSLVMACQSQDSHSLISVEGELWKHLDSLQRTLLRCLVDTVTSASDN